MSKDISEESSRAGTASDAAVVQSEGVLSMRGFGVTIIRFVIIGGFCFSGKSRRDGGSNPF